MFDMFDMPGMKKCLDSRIVGSSMRSLFHSSFKECWMRIDPEEYLKVLPKTQRYIEYSMEKTLKESSPAKPAN